MEKLTPQETAVVSLLCEGLKNYAIGRRLGITEATANAHVRSLLRKFGCANRAELAARAVALGVVKMSDPGARADDEQ